MRMLWALLGFLLLAGSAHAQLPQTQCVSTAVAAGTGDALTIPLLPCTETTTLLVLTFTAANATSAPTISVNGQTPHVIVNFDTTALSGGLLQPNQRRLLTYNGTNWILLGGGSGGGGSCPVATTGSLGCVIPDGTTISVDGAGHITAKTATSSTLGIVKPDNSTITISNGVLTAAAAAPPTCGTLPAGGCPFDIAMFWPGVPPNAAIVRIAITRAVSCSAALPGSVGIAKEAATSSAVVNINQVTSGSGTLRGTATWSGGGTVAAFAAASPISFAANDIVEFAFPGTADATLGDIAITLKCSRT